MGRKQYAAESNVLWILEEYRAACNEDDVWRACYEKLEGGTSSDDEKSATERDAVMNDRGISTTLDRKLS